MNKAAIWVVTASRYDIPWLEASLTSMLYGHGRPLQVFAGDAPGGDAQTHAWCRENRILSFMFCASREKWLEAKKRQPACLVSDWDEDGPSAGPKRSEFMVRLAGPLALVAAFPHDTDPSRGTRRCADFARGAGNRVLVFGEFR